MLITTYTQQEVSIINTYFIQKPQYKYNFKTSRDQKSIADFRITNRIMHPKDILVVRVMTFTNATTEHGQILCKYHLE